MPLRRRHNSYGPFHRHEINLWLTLMEGQCGSYHVLLFTWIWCTCFKVMRILSGSWKVYAVNKPINEDSYHLGCNTVEYDESQSTFRGTYFLNRQGLRVNPAGSKIWIHCREKLLPLLVESMKNHKELNIVGVSIKIRTGNFLKSETLPLEFSRYYWNLELK
jgi:hypothetical protein